MCKICEFNMFVNEHKIESKDITFGNGVVFGSLSLWIDKTDSGAYTLSTTLMNHDSMIKDIPITINNCPFCGRELNTSRDKQSL